MALQPHELEAQDIEHYLDELGEELQQQGIQQPIRILVVGGAFMLLQIQSRTSTRDIDVLFKDFEDVAAMTTFMKTAQNTPIFRWGMNAPPFLTGYPIAWYTGGISKKDKTHALRRL